MGTESKTSANTYLIQLNLQPTPTGILNDLIQVTNYNENGTTSKKSTNEANLLMIKAEKLSANSIVKCIKKFKSSSMCVSSSRKVASLLSAQKNHVKIFELEVDEDDDDDEEMEENENEFEENPSTSASVEATNNMVDIKPINQQYSNKAPFTKQISSSSSVLSMGSSTAATVGSANTTLRGKRKKDFEDEDEDDNTTTGISEYDESINNDLQSVGSGYKVNLASSDMAGVLNFVPGDTIEISANQNNNQQIHDSQNWVKYSNRRIRVFKSVLLLREWWNLTNPFFCSYFLYALSFLPQNNITNSTTKIIITKQI